MPHRKRQVEEERLARRLAALHEVYGLGSKLGSDFGANVPREGFHRFQRPAEHGLDDLRSLRQQHIGRRVDRVREFDRVDVGGRIPGDVGRDAVELVKAMRGRQALRLAAEMLLAINRRGVAEPVEHIAHRVGMRREGGVGARNEDQRQAVANGILRRHKRRARGCARGLDQILREPKALARQLIDAWRWGAAQFAAAVGAEVAVADVIGKDEHDVGLLVLSQRRQGEGNRTDD
jgi:hypothetical protein